MLPFECGQPELEAIRMAVLNMLPGPKTEPARGRRWLLRRRSGAEPGEAAELGEQTELRTTPAADKPRRHRAAGHAACGVGAAPRQARPARYRGRLRS
jgi:hypothetical protein